MLTGSILLTWWEYVGRLELAGENAASAFGTELYSTEGIIGTSLLGLNSISPHDTSYPDDARSTYNPSIHAHPSVLVHRALLPQYGPLGCP
jgi:hypothetical protein